MPRYKKEERKKEGYKGNAAVYFLDELLAVGLQTRQKIVCEGFSRDIRGASPNNKDIMLAQQMAHRLTLPQQMARQWRLITLALTLQRELR